MEQDNNQPITQVIKKSKGPVVCSALCIILALAGIGFGVYGMFFNKPSAPAAKSDDNTSTVTEEIPSRETVAKLLKDKYDLDEYNAETCGGRILTAGVFDNDGDFDSLVKVSLILKKEYLRVDRTDFNECNGLCVYDTISYDELNEKAHKLFGNSYDLAKEGYGKPYVTGIDDVEYVAESDSFKVKYITGIGCANYPVGDYVNVVDVKATDNGFTASVSVLMLDILKWNETHDYYIDDLSEAKTEQKAYSLDFIEEDGEYKLVNVTKK